MTNAQRRAITRQRAGTRAPIGVGGAAPRQRTTSKASGSRGWYDSPEWRARSKAFLAANPVCCQCQRRKATQADHNPPVRPDDRDGVLHGPIEPKCWPCHSAKTRREQGDDGRLSKVHKPLVKGCDVNGMPRDSNHPWCKENTNSPKNKNVSAKYSAPVGLGSCGGRNGESDGW